MELSASVVKMIQVAEARLCPQYCGLVERRRVIAFLFTTIIEALVVPSHFALFFYNHEIWGFSVNMLHLVALLIIQYLTWGRRITFEKGIASLFLLVDAKLVVDSFLCAIVGRADDDISIFGNMFIMFILSISALSMVLHKTAYAIALGIVPVLTYYIYIQTAHQSLVSMKAIFVGFMMIAYVTIYNMSRVTTGLRQPRDISPEEKKALDMLAHLKDMDYDKAGSLLARLGPELRDRVINHATERLRKEEIDTLAWDMICSDLTNSEREICKLIVKGLTLKQICMKLDKTESNITSQRSHIRKKLNLERNDDLKRALERRIAEIRQSF